MPAEGKLLAFSNNGSLFEGARSGDLFFASEAETLRKLNCQNIDVVDGCRVLDVAVSDEQIVETDITTRERELVPSLNVDS